MLVSSSILCTLYWESTKVNLLLPPRRLLTLLLLNLLITIQTVLLILLSFVDKRLSKRRKQYYNKQAKSLLEIIFEAFIFSLFKISRPFSYIFHFVIERNCSGKKGGDMQKIKRHCAFIGSYNSHTIHIIGKNEFKK